MGIIKIGVGIILLIILLIILFLLAESFIRVMKIIVIEKKKGKKGEILKKHCKHKIIYGNYNKVIDLIRWIIYDFVQGKDKINLFGIWCFTGYYGQGKTLGVVAYANLYKEMYGKKIKVYSNFKLKFADGKFKNPEDIVRLSMGGGRKIFLFDEIQACFNTQNYKEFPMDLLWAITQCRKLGVAVFATAPVYQRMSVQLRDSTDRIVVCKNMGGLDRWFRYSHYRASDYEKYYENVDEGKAKKTLDKKRLRVENLIASEHDYRRYETSEIVERINEKKIH